MYYGDVYNNSGCGFFPQGQIMAQLLVFFMLRGEDYKEIWFEEKVLGEAQRWPDYIEGKFF